MTLHYVIQKDGARDLVLPPPDVVHSAETALLWKLISALTDKLLWQP